MLVDEYFELILLLFRSLFGSFKVFLLSTLDFFVVTNLGDSFLVLLVVSDETFCAFKLAA